MLETRKHIWVIEDEEGARYVYQSVLGEKYALKLLASVEEMRTALALARPDLMLCDLSLPGESFLAFLESGEAKMMEGIPFLVVSALDDSEALRKCFAKGAMDYITKPFGKSELLVKTECILNRPKSASASGLYGQQNGLRVDPSTMRAHYDQASSPLLTSKEFQILSLLQQAPQHMVTRNEIIEQIWGNVQVGSKTLDVHIFNLRRKLNLIQVEIAFSAPNQYQLALK